MESAATVFRQETEHSVETEQALQLLDAQGASTRSEVKALIEGAQPIYKLLDEHDKASGFVLQGRSGVSTFRDAGKRAHLYGGNHLMFGKIQQLIAALKAWSATQPRPKQRAVDNALSKLLKYWDGKGKEMVTVPTMGDGVALKKSFTYSEYFEKLKLFDPRRKRDKEGKAFSLNGAGSLQRAYA